MKKLITLASLLILTSCGSRKSTTNKTVEKSESKVEVKAEVQSNVTTNTETNTITIDTSTTNEIVIEPINPLVEFVVNGKTYKNARITTKKVKSGVNVVNNVKVAKNEANTSKTDYKADKKDFKKAKPRVVERKQFNFLSLWWLYLLIFILITFWYNRKKLFGLWK